MKRFAWLLITALLAFAPVSAFAADSFLLMGVGAAPSGGPPSGYVGPGDIVGGAKEYWGLRAYSAAQADGTHLALNARNSTTTETCDVLLSTSGGLGNVKSCSGSSNGLSVETFCGAACTVPILYGQAGGVNAQNGNTTKQPTLVFNCSGSTPCLHFSGGQVLATSLTATAQPLTISAVARRTGTSTQNDILSGANGVFFTATYPQAGGYFGNSFGVSASDNDLHALQFVIASPNSQVNVDGATSSASTGSSGLLVSPFIGAQSSTPTSALTGDIAEIAVYQELAFSSAQQAAVCHNQHVYWGTPTSC